MAIIYNSYNGLRIILYILVVINFKDDYFFWNNYLFFSAPVL
jgi:hypothetical protein